MDYIKRADVLALISKIMQDESITHKQRSLTRQIKQMPCKDIQDSDAVAKSDIDAVKTEIITPEQVKKMSSEEIVMEIPCLVGDPIWYIDTNYKIQEAQVVRIIIDGFYNRYIIASRYDYDTEETVRLALRFEDLNSDYWLTKEPAEERLKEIIDSMKLILSSKKATDKHKNQRSIIEK